MGVKGEIGHIGHRGLRVNEFGNYSWIFSAIFLLFLPFFSNDLVTMYFLLVLELGLSVNPIFNELALKAIHTLEHCS